MAEERGQKAGCWRLAVLTIRPYKQIDKTPSSGLEFLVFAGQAMLGFHDNLLHDVEIAVAVLVVYCIQLYHAPLIQ